jgi:hypothetical protein
MGRIARRKFARPTAPLVKRSVLLTIFVLIVALWLLIVQGTFWWASPYETFGFTQPRKRCQQPVSSLSPHQVEAAILPNPPPTGIVVTLLLSDTRLVTAICSVFQSQLTHFIVPHGLDILFVVSGGLESKTIIDCLDLTARENGRHTWNNLDGTIITTDEYRVMTVTAGVPHTTRVFLAETPVHYPAYIRQNSSILKEPIQPPMCQADPNYIQGTRWYTNEMLHLGLLQEYEYWVKVDPDIVFNKAIPIHLLHDMKIRGAVFAHSAEYPATVASPCSDHIVDAIREFQQQYQHQAPLDPSWDGHICSTNTCLQVNSDRYYTNFIIGKTSYFQSPRVLELGRFLSEYANGFFRHRWTDQIFFHFALGLFLADFQDYVVDYTEFRCAPLANCWMSSLELKVFSSFCDNDGYFLHTKNVLKWAHRWNRHMIRKEPLERGLVPYKTIYVHDCRGTRWRQG